MGKNEISAAELKQRYDSFANTLDYNTTASDYNLREIEIDKASEYMCDGKKTLDIGCGLGYAVSQYASRFKIEAHGVDYSENMVKGAEILRDKNYPEIVNRTFFHHASVTELPFESDTFDVITSSRCLMALLDWDLQKIALKELHRVLKPGGIFVMMEGTNEGLDKLNNVREMFELEPIDAKGSDRLFTEKFSEKDLLEYVKPFFIHENTCRFGMYYFLTRVVQPLLVSPEQPSYDHKLNAIARQISRLIPDFDGLGHLVAFIFQKR